MRRIWAIAICGAAISGPAGWAAEPEGSRFRDRLPDAATERPAPSIAKTPAEDSDGSSEAAFIAAPDTIRLDGAVAIAPERFESLFAQYVRRGLTRADLVALTRAITDNYRAEGYFLSRAVIPPQKVSNGVLTVKVEEGRFASVEFKDGNGDDLRDYFAPLLAEIPARRATLERAILTLGDLSGVTVLSSETIPAPGVRGDYTLVLKVARDAADGMIYLDNRGERGETPQLSAQAGFNGIGVAGSRLEVSVFTDPGDPARRQFAEVSVSAPLGLRGTIVSASAAASNSVDGQFGAGRYRSGGTDVSVGIKLPVLRTRAHSMWVNLDLVQSNSEASIETLGLRRDELTMARIGANWDVRDNWGGRNRLNLGVTFGRDGFSAPTPAHPMSRNDDGTAFTKFTLLASRTQAVAGAWSVFASLRGQYSAENLPEDEEISFGGARWGRAFDYGEIEGDTGAAGQLELRYTRDDVPLTASLQGYAFADIAAAWARDGEGEPDTLSSAGLGLRAAFASGYRAGLEAAVPLDRVPSGAAGRDPRVFATVSKEF